MTLNLKKKVTLTASQMLAENNRATADRLTWAAQTDEANLRTALNVPENTAYVGIRAHYFTAEGTENAIPCTVERVVENPFSTVVMLQTAGAGMLRWELDKAAWAALADTEKLALYVRPEDVMPLTE